MKHSLLTPFHGKGPGRQGTKLLAMLGLALAATLCSGQFADDGFNPNANNTVSEIALQADGKIVIGGSFAVVDGVARTFVARVHADSLAGASLSADPSFTPGVINGLAVRALAIQPDGKIIIGGLFDDIAGQERNNIARLNADGSLDAAFNPNANGTVWSLAVQPDGKILAGGDFTRLGGHVITSLARLNADGSLDTAFDPLTDSAAYAIVLQPDGKILVGGSFTLMGDQPHTGIARLNADGSLDTSFANSAGANDDVQCLAVQPDGKIILVGDFTSVAGQDRNHIARLNADGSLDAAYNPNANGTVYSLALQADGKAVVGGSFATLGNVGRNHIGRLNLDGTLDTTYDCPGGANGSVQALAVQADGKILAGGWFGLLGGATRNNVGRTYPDGKPDANFLDADFNPALGVSDTVYAMAHQPNWRVLIGGLFLNISGNGRMRLARLEPDGTPDALNPLADASARSIAMQADGKILVGGFFTHLDVPEYPYIARLDTANNPEAAFQPDPDGAVRCILPLTNGQIVIAGEFAKIGAADRVRIGRLNADGTLDNTFNVPGGADGIVYSALIQPDGKIVVAGEFTQLAGVERRRIGRLNPDGSLDETFNPQANNPVYTVAQQADGKLLIGGIFTALGAPAVERLRIARLNVDGTLDTSFAVPGGANFSVRSIAVQADGKILVGGAFNHIGNLAIKYLAQLNADGSLDSDYYPDPNMPDATVHGLLLQADGKCLIGGDFTTLDAYTRKRLARITPTRPALQQLAANASGTLITWTRTGSCPELARVAFEHAPDGATWTPLGAGTRITNGWQLAVAALAPNTNHFIRARGFYRSGYMNSSLSACESVRLVYLTPPALAITNISGTVTQIDATSCALLGTANTNVVGSIRWTNSLTGGSGAFPAAAAWNVTNIALNEGTNVLTVSGSNALGTAVSDSVNVLVQWSQPLAADFDGDGCADPAAGLGTNLYVWLSQSSYARLGPFPYGLEGAVFLAADFDGDAYADPAAYQGVNWYVWLSDSGYSRVGPVAYGVAGAAPVAADFDGDAYADPAVYAGTNWIVWLSGSGYAAVGPVPFGIAGATPAAADFDCDRYADPAVYLDGDWTAWVSGSGYARIGPYHLGAAGALPMAADFDGDHVGDVAVSDNRLWYAWCSCAGYDLFGPYEFNLRE